MALDKLGGKIQRQGNQTRNTTFDPITHNLLTDIKSELKLIRILLADMAEYDIVPEEVEKEE